MSTVYFMIGLPYSGKTTYVKSKENLKNLPIVSSDKFVHKLCGDEGISYNEGFRKHIKEAQGRMFVQVKKMIKDKRDFVFDRTNLTKASRRRWIKIFNNAGYNVVAISFNNPLQYSQIGSRISSRPEQIISKEVYDEMLKKYERPDMSEGFYKIVDI